MRFSRRIALLLVIAITAVGFAAEKKAAVPSGNLVDSGSFGVFVHGKRVATETFQIEQMADMSVAKSEFKVEEGTTKAVQTAELVMAANGDLRRYTWNELSPNKAQTTIEPHDQFLVQHISTGSTDKPIDQPYILPTSTVILDDYFFSQREVLAWRYLGANCRPEPGSPGCKLQRVQFGALIPRQRTSLLVNIEYVGRETVNVHGQKRELSRFNLQSEGMDWGLWLDENYKLIRIYIAAEATEVVRD
ncbi:MAG: hypothetical protein LAO06_18245 [Acidobacteriia bacterium]|nr:hypothetical protein [Terriglobia bacterium]